MEPKVASGFPGYYEIPGFDRYAITTNGQLIDKKTNRVKQANRHPSGYYDFSVMVNGKKTTVGRHRLMGLAFSHPDVGVSNLVVNHLDGVKGNDELLNLEWTTHQGNIEHAGVMGLTTKCIPISVRNVDTGEVLKYPSAVEYARGNGLTKDAVLWRLRCGESSVFPERKQYRRGHDDAPWKTPTRSDERNGRSRPVLLRRVLSDEVYQFPKLTEAAKFLNVKLPYLFKHVNNPDQPVLPGYIQVKWDDDSDWRFVEDPQLELDITTGNKSVVVVNENTGERKIYSSATECAKVFGVGKTTLSFRLKSNGSKVFDGFRFCYYSSAVNGPLIE